MKVAVSVAGSDSIAGAGIQGDLKTFEAHGVYCATVLTAVTVQDTRQVTEVLRLPPSIVRDQLLAVLADVPVAGIKIGMLATSGIAREVHNILMPLYDTLPVVLDPVVASSSNTSLLDIDGVDFIRSEMLANVRLITPNVREAALLAGVHPATNLSPEELGQILIGQGANSVLVTGGDTPVGGVVTDLLLDRSRSYAFTSPFLHTSSTHGSGCTLASSICANLISGYSLIEAVGRGRDFTFNAIRRAPDLGHGRGPLLHQMPGHD